MSGTALPLSEGHLKMLLEGSAISEDVIRQRGYRTILHQNELAYYGFSPAQRRLPIGF